MHYVRRLLKNVLALSLYHSGLLYFIASLRLKNRATVLMYHRVISQSRQNYCHSSPGIVVQEETFRRHLAFLKGYFQLLSLDEFIGHLENGTPFPDKSCLITFDDGWIDNYRTAYPILREYGVPATIFLPFEYIGSKRIFWQEEINLRVTRFLVSDDDSDRQFVKQLIKSEKIPSKEELQSYIQDLKRRGYAAIATVLERVRNHKSDATIPKHDNQYIDWHQAKEMMKHGISFGSHCMSHRMLTHLSTTEKRIEIAESKSLLQSKLDCGVEAIAYPNGDFDDQVIAIVHGAGYKAGFSTMPGYVSSETDLFAIPRANIHEHAAQSEAMLLCTILGLF